MSYHLSLQYPRHIKPAAERLDCILWHMLEESVGFSIPQIEEGKGVECVLAPPVQSLANSSFQSLLVRLQVRLGGLGLRSLADSIPAAFIGSIEMSLPHFVGENGIIPQLDRLTLNLLL